MKNKKILLSLGALALGLYLWKFGGAAKVRKVVDFNAATGNTAFPEAAKTGGGQ